jgi:hypothetical protein
LPKLHLRGRARRIVDASAVFVATRRKTPGRLPRGRVVALLWQPIFRYNSRVKAVFIVIREF